MDRSAQPHTEVILETPSPLRLSEPQRLRFLARDTVTGLPVTDIVESHERPAHLISVRQDLEHFQHLHPVAATLETLEVDVVLSHAGPYLFFLEFARADGEHVLARIERQAGEGPSAMKSGLAPDLGPLPVGDHFVSLSTGPNVTAGQISRLGFRVENANARQGVALRPYLGAAAHVVILDEAGEAFAHTHASDDRNAEMSGHAGHHAGAVPTADEGIDLRVEHIFPRPGLYRLWLQYLPLEDDVRTAPFVVDVD